MEENLNRIVAPSSESAAAEPLTLDTFITKHSTSLPVRVVVDKGFCGAEEKCVISAGDKYNIHFVKATKIVTIHDSNGHQYSIPFNSAIEFGPLYDPNNNFEEAFKGFRFETVSDILAQKTLPKIVRAQTAHVAGDVKSSVTADELLIIKRVAKTMPMRHSVLKVYSMTAGEDKTLHEDCAGCFTTNPYSVRLYTPELIQHLHNPFPLKAMLCISVNTPDDLPLHLTSEVVTLTKTSTETSLIASTYWEGQEQPSEEDQIPIEIPIDLDIEVTVLPTEENEVRRERLLSETKSLYEYFDPSKIMPCKDAPTGDKFKAQATLYRAVRQGHENVGVELKKPSLAYEYIETLPRQGGKQLPPTPPIAEDKPPVPGRSISSQRPSTAAAGISSEVLSKISELEATTGSFRSLVTSLEDRMEKQFAQMKAKLVRVIPTMEELSRQTESLQSDVKTMKQQIALIQRQSARSQQPRPGPVTDRASTTPTATTEERNKEDLCAMSHKQVSWHF